MFYIASKLIAALSWFLDLTVAPFLTEEQQIAVGTFLGRLFRDTYDQVDAHPAVSIMACLIAYAIIKQSKSFFLFLKS